MRVEVTQAQRDTLAGFVPHRAGVMADTCAAIVRAFDEAMDDATKPDTIEPEGEAEGNLVTGTP